MNRSGGRVKLRISLKIELSQLWFGLTDQQKHRAMPHLSVVLSVSSLGVKFDTGTKNNKKVNIKSSDSSLISSRFQLV